MNGTVTAAPDEHGNPLFTAKSVHNGETFTFFSSGAAAHWLWLRNELYGSLAIRGRLPEGYRGPFAGA